MSFVRYDAECDFPIQNLPYGVFRAERGTRCCVAIGDKVVDLKVLADAKCFDEEVNAAFQEETLNKFMGLGKKHWQATRAKLTQLLGVGEGSLDNNALIRDQALLDQTSVKMQLPCRIGDYTDFYSSREHATNVGKMFRPDGAPLLPNWLHLPVGYHGRASSIVVSGTDIRRPCGQTRPNDNEPPVFGPCKLLDMEVEIGAFVGPGNKLGERITMQTVKDQIFGLTLFNDWSARDIQKWEYVPLGPFLAKSFASTISPWIVTMDALEPFICDGPPQGAEGDPQPLPYLQQPFPGSFDINLSASLKPAGRDNTVRLCNTNFKSMYWSVFQQLVHHTVNGCNMNPGDCFASGTISGSTPDSFGSMLEISWRGANPVDIGGGQSRRFFQDGDECMLRGHCQGDGYRIGFGPCDGTITKALEC
ncbi:Fumarylacetoacetase [Diplonema papillatum]|nr:Fumarylacetoacetase [Diplonema papillatum]